MSRRPIQDIRIKNIQHRQPGAKTKRPWIVRWVVDGQERSRSFRTKAEADRHRTLLLAAVHQGEAFDPRSCEPVSWLPSPDEVRVHAWARRWLAEQWLEWQPRTQTSAVEALMRFVPLVTARSAPPPPAGLRAHLRTTLRPGCPPDPDDPCEQWLDHWCLGLADLDREVLADADAKLGIGDQGQALSGWTAARYRKVARACVRRSVDLDVLETDPWPPSPKGRAKRKAHRSKRGLDIRTLPDPATMARAIDAIQTHQPGSRLYKVMTAVAYYGGLRPSEIVVLRPRNLRLPPTGWGRIEVVEADVLLDEPGETKTGDDRSVPIPPLLVALLSQWLADHQFADNEPIFRSRTGLRPHPSNWWRAWQRVSRVKHLAQVQG